MARDLLVRRLLEMDLSQVAVSACLVNAGGALDRVGAPIPKVAAAWDAALVVGRIRHVILSDDQHEIAEGPLGEGRLGNLTVSKAPTLAALVERLYRRLGPWAAVRSHEAHLHRHFYSLAGPLEWGPHHQPVRLRLRLPRRPDAPGALDVPPLPDSLPGWEEAVRQSDAQHGPPRTLEEVLSSPHADVVPRLLVIGPPGSGKTTLHKYLIHRTAVSTWPGLGPLLPACVSLRDWVARRDDLGLEEYLAWRCERLPPPEEGWVERWRSWLRQGDVLLLVDGLDEIPTNGPVPNNLADALTHYRCCPAVLTCRSLDVERYHRVCHGFDVFLLDGLRGEEQRSFVATFPGLACKPEDLLGEIQRHPQLRALAATPLLLEIVCWVCGTPQQPGGPVQLPATRGELLGRALGKFLDRDREPADGVPRWPTTTCLHVLEEIALWLLLHSPSPRWYYEAAELDEASRAADEALRQTGSDLGLSDPLRRQTLLEDLRQNRGILRYDNSGYCFLHKLPQEYLAASAVARRVEMPGGLDAILETSVGVRTVKQLLEAKSWDPNWQEVICLLAGQLADPTGLLDLLCDKAGDDLSRHRLALAMRCLPEIRQKEKVRHQIDAISAAVDTLWKRHNSLRATGALEEVERALPSLVQALGGPQHTPPPARTDSPVPLASPPAPAAPPLEGDLLAQLAGSDEGQRQAAVEAMVTLRDAVTPEFLADLLALLRGSARPARRAAVEALGRLGRAAARQDVLDELLPLLREGADPNLCWAAADTVGRLGPKAATPEVLAALMPLLENPRAPNLQQAAAGAVARLTADGCRLFRDGDVWRANSVEVLARLD